MGWKFKDINLDFAGDVADFTDKHPWIWYFISVAITFIVLVCIRPDAWLGWLVTSFVIGYFTSFILLLAIGLLEVLLRLLFSPIEYCRELLNSDLIEHIIYTIGFVAIMLVIGFILFY